MKQPWRSIAALLCLVCLFGCARFSTKQIDLSYDNQGKPKRKITTRATSYALFASKSSLANFKASQTDKTQGASVGTLNQEAQGSVTNLAVIVEAVVRGAVAGVK